MSKLNCAMLLGFDADLQDQTARARLGAKVGTENDEPHRTTTRNLEPGRLLGFDMVVDKLSDGLDLRDDEFGSKLGAKVGDPEAV
jgi:hypothetical protein